MSFSLYVYACALVGAWAAFLGWMVGRMVPVHDAMTSAGIRGMFLGVFIALGLSGLDAYLELNRNRLGQWFGRVGMALLVGMVGGAVGGLVGQTLFARMPYAAFLVLGWTITGTLVGSSIALFELLERFLSQQPMKWAVRKMLRATLGGTAGGVLGGFASVAFRGLWAGLFKNHSLDDLWSPSGTGFIILGACIGLLVGFAQVIFQEAWLTVKQGFRPGREYKIAKPKVILGRAEGCEVGLFGDAAVEPEHANITVLNGEYFLHDGGTPGGTFVNGVRITGPTLLKHGDLIQMGNSLLRFGARRKRPAKELVPAAAH